jgi:CubicO group peptidase (beta-lactamase class C family)
MAEWKKGPVDISSKDAAYDVSKFTLLEKHYGTRIDMGKIQAAGFLMAREGRVFANQAAGKLTHKADSKPFTVDAIKNIASISKTITSTAVMKLVQDGALWLEQPVKHIIKEFDTPMHGGISIRHLLTHTSGLPADHGYFTEPYPVDHWEAIEKKDWLIKSILAGPIQSQPGKHWAYCSLGFMVLAEIVSRVSGIHFNEFVEKNIFTPLGMTHSFLEVPERLWPEVSLMADWDEKRLTRGSLRKGPPDGGGGVYSTLHDLFIFGQMTMNGGIYKDTRILGKKTVQEMTRNQLSGIPAFHWGKHLTDFRHGLGWGFYCDGSITGPETYNHQGWGASYLFVDPVERFIFVLFVADPHDWNPELVVEPVNITFSGII